MGRCRAASQNRDRGVVGGVSDGAATGVERRLETCHGLESVREAPKFHEWHAEGTAPLQPPKIRVIPRSMTSIGTSKQLQRE